jgi:hypothetical protein
MKMRNYFSFVLVILFLAHLTSCTKETTGVDSANSRMALLTSNVWIYDSIYNNWGLPTQQVIFVLNGQSNIQDWSSDRVKFYRDGTFNEILASGNLRQGPDIWTMNSDSTEL